jgi:hypothetical protein
MSAGNPRISYFAVGYGSDGSEDDALSAGTFNVFNPSISTGMFNTVAPYQTKSQLVTLNAAEFANTPSRGVMVISHDNGSDLEARLIGF